MGAVSLSLLPLTAHSANPLVAHVTSPRVLGSVDAPIKVVELFSMTCSHCANFHNNTFPEVKKRLIDTDMVRFEMQPFPFDQYGLRAHALVRALPQHQYFPMVSYLLQDIGRWARSTDPIDALKKIAQRQAGMTLTKFDLAMSDPIFEAIIGMQQNAHKTWKIESTPSFVINNKTILSGDISYEEFASKIDATNA